jgi:RsiW-degrading membrane proteinase PrsW (M82 family)
MDGIIYGTMAGIGVGTLLNLHYVLDSGGVALGQGVVHIVTTVLAQASFGGITGYFMGQAKFEHKPIWWVPAGLTIAALMNGLFVWLVSEAGADGLTVVPWRSLLLGVLVAGAAFAILLVLINRATQPVAVASPE